MLVYDLIHKIRDGGPKPEEPITILLLQIPMSFQCRNNVTIQAACTQSVEYSKADKNESCNN